MERSDPTNERRSARLTRRRALCVAGIGASALVGAGILHLSDTQSNSVFIAKGQAYDRDLVQSIRDGLVACGVNRHAISGKRVLLKPNFVEPRVDIPYMTTHPAVVLAAAEVFLAWGADVLVGEASGHVRDSDAVLIESGMSDALEGLKLPFFDLNYSDVVWRPNEKGLSALPGFFFPSCVATADLIVSMPKLKTHHWIGVTGALKNMYGTIPGCIYGWPKNVLHFGGIPETVVDINMSLPRTLAIVDAIDCMEGDGPIMGTKKHMGLIVVGSNLLAVDATLCRLMDVNPYAVAYLSQGAGLLGRIEDSAIDQRGEAWPLLSSPFKLIKQSHLQPLIEHRLGFKL